MYYFFWPGHPQKFSQDPPQTSKMENFATKVYNEKPFSFVAKLILGVFRVLGYASDPSIPHSSKLNFMTFIYQPERHISEV